MGSISDTKTMALPDYTTTPMAAVEDAHKTTFDTFRTFKTKAIEYRKVQLRKLYWAIRDYAPQLSAAIYADMRKHPHESALTEIDWVQNDCLFMLKHLDKLVADERLGTADVPFIHIPNKFRVHKEPLGTPLIIGAYNYPVNLLLGPLVGAIGAGCTAVMKPSEGAPATAAVIAQLVEERLDQSAYRVVNGAVPETTKLLELKWDKIFYTGSATVGKIVAVAAAKTLTPVVLELGGRSPAFVTKNANLDLAARRLMWGKTLNAGQVCMSSNYIMVERSVMDDFVKALNKATQTMMPEGTKASKDLARIINERHFLRMKRMLDDTKGEIVMGGKSDKDALFIEPTAVLVSSANDSMMEQESFGPIFSVMPYDTLAEALTFANSIDPTPLSTFCFGSDADFDQVLNGITSGGISKNDTFMHGSIGSIPFGGVGSSGTGAWRGRASFHAFTHRRTVAETPTWFERFLRVRYMPYQSSELRLLRFLTRLPIGFDREGNVERGGWLATLLRLGGSGTKGALLRWVVVAAGLLSVLMAKKT